MGLDEGVLSPTRPDTSYKVSTMSKFAPLAAIVCVVVLASPLWAQVGSSTRTGSTGTGAAFNGRPTTGLQQTGQLSASAAIQRSANDVVGGSTGSFLSRSGSGGATTGANTGLNSTLNSITGGLGLGLGFSGGLGGRGGFGGGLGGFSGIGQQNLNMNQTTGSNVVRTTLRLGFDPHRVESSAVSERLATRLPRIPGLETVSGVDVKMDGKTAVIRGVVATQRQRSLISRLALLEPGISDVRNELTVDPDVAPQRPSLLESVPSTPVP
jgi:hypothetical protein